MGLSELRASDINFRTRAIHEALITGLALKRYRLKMGEYPDNLETLMKSKFIKKLPSDPYSDKIMRYKKVKNDFLLYSVGADFTDNQGVRSYWWILSGLGLITSQFSFLTLVFWF